MGKISILIADDHKLVRETWTHFLNEDPRFRVVADCGRTDEAVELARKKRPRVILMDIIMNPFSGIEATRQIRASSPDSGIVGVSMHSEPAYAKRMIEMGARGYVTKNSSRNEMIKAILAVNDGKKYICDEIKNIISSQLLEETPVDPDINALTRREIEIINFIKDGFRSREIAVRLELSLKTVEVHRHNILKKLKLKNVATLVNFIHNSSGIIRKI